VAELQCYRGDPVARVDAALAEAPGFAMAHALKGWLHLLGTEPGGLPVARRRMRRRRAAPRRHGRRAMWRRSASGRGALARKAGRVLEDVTIEAPRDALGLLAGHQIDFFTGHSRMLRDRIARALPHWDEGDAGLSLGARHACLRAGGDRGLCPGRGGRAAGRRARAAGRLVAARGRPCDGDAEPQADGIAWMRANDGWAGDSFFQVHNWWHLALYHLEIGDIDAVLALFDDEIGGGPVGRRHGHGRRLGAALAAASARRRRRRSLAGGGRRLGAVATAGAYAFNDAHAVMAFVGAGRRGGGGRARGAEARRWRGRATTRASPPRSAMRSAAPDRLRRRRLRPDGALLRPVRSIAAPFRRQPCAARRDRPHADRGGDPRGDAALAAALARSAFDRRHESPLSQLFVRRARRHFPAS
jgi:hypothetical protein